MCQLRLLDILQVVNFQQCKKRYQNYLKDEHWLVIACFMISRSFSSLIHGATFETHQGKHCNILLTVIVIRCHKRFSIIIFEFVQMLEYFDPGIVHHWSVTLHILHIVQCSCHSKQQSFIRCMCTFIYLKNNSRKCNIQGMLDQ